MHLHLFILHYLFFFLFFTFQACKGEDLGKVEFDEEIKKRFKMVYVPNWFSVDLKTGVSHDPGSIFVLLVVQQSILSVVL